MINEIIQVLDIPGIKGIEKITRDETVKALFDNRGLIEGKFINDEWLKMDLTHGEIIGLKSNSKIDIGGFKDPIDVGDLPAFNFMISRNEKYKNANLINLGKVSMLFKETI